MNFQPNFHELKALQYKKMLRYFYALLAVDWVVSGVYVYFIAIKPSPIVLDTFTIGVTVVFGIWELGHLPLYPWILKNLKKYSPDKPKID